MLLRAAISGGRRASLTTLPRRCDQYRRPPRAAARAPPASPVTPEKVPSLIYTTDIKIRGYHLDVYGHVNNTRWVELLEEARWRWLDQDVDLRTWDARGQGIAVVSLTVNYRRPARAHDELEFRCWIVKLGGRSAVCRQEVVRRSDGERLLDADVTFVLFDLATGRPRAMAGDARAAFEKYRQPREDAP